MQEPRKAAEIRLDLYALAQARAEEVWQATAKRCADCPGPDADDGCRTRPFTGVVVGRSDWPLCPRGMTRARTWRAIVDRYVDAQISPLSGFPERYKSVATRGFRELRQAIRAEDERQAKQTSRPNALPRYAGMRNARPTSEG